MSDDLEDLIVQSILQGQKSECLRLLKTLEKNSSSAEEFSNSLAQIFCEEEWHHKDEITVWEQIVNKYQNQLQDRDVHRIVSQAVFSNQFYMVTNLLNHNITVDFGDNDILFGSLMSAPLDMCKMLDEYWSWSEYSDMQKYYAPLAVAAALNPEPKVLQHVLNRLNSLDVLNETKQIRTNNVVTWGENVFFNVENETLDEIERVINRAQSRRIESSILSSGLASPVRKI